MTSTIDRGRRGSPESLLSDRFYGTPSGSYGGWIEAAAFEVSPTLNVPFGDDREIVFKGQLQDWQKDVIAEVAALGSLAKNWNSYRSAPISIETAAFVMCTLLNLLKHDDPVPSIVPTSRGGILVEWHVAGVDLEIDFRSPTWVQISFEKDGDEIEIKDASPSEIGQCFSWLRQSR